MNIHQNGAERLPTARVVAWALLSAFGCVLGLATALMLSLPLMVLLTPGGALVVLGGLIGLAVGGAQWWVLRACQIVARGWVWSSALGAVGGLLAGFALARASGNLGFMNPWDTALVGVGIGVAQWLILRRSVRQAGWWVLASTLGWGIALWGRSGAPPGALIVVSVAALAYGVSTGLVFARMAIPCGEGRYNKVQALQSCCIPRGTRGGELWVSHHKPRSCYGARRAPSGVSWDWLRPRWP